MKNQPLWYKNAVFYEVYLRAFCDSDGDGQGDLRGLMSKLDYLQELGVDCLWLLPIYLSPLLDDGYDIADYYNILPEYGTLDDFKALLSAAHQRGMRVIADLVLNHTSDQHQWFRSAASSRDDRYRNYYVWSDDDEKFREARIIFLDTEKSNWAWSEPTGQYYWHRFYSSQPDLNYANPEVQEEMLRVADFWLSLGVDGFRADAVPYLFEREGTNCENLPETHDYLKRLRSFIDQHHPGKILLCEANQWPEDVREYFGNGDEFHMGFHFPLMPRIFMALRQGNTSALTWILERTPSIPDGCQWCLFLRNHDELTLEMVTEDERQWMWQEYAPEMRMRLNLGIRRRLAPLLDNDRRKIDLANSLLFTLPGSPTIYYGDEIGMGDNIELFDRNGVRTPMQWDDTLAAGFSTASPDLFYAPVIETEPYNPARVNVADQQKDPGSLWNTLRRMVAMRKQHPAFGWGDFTWATPGSPTVAAYWRGHSSEMLLVVNNLSADPQCITIQIPGTEVPGLTDLWSGENLTPDGTGEISLELNPYQYLWLKTSTRG